MYRMMVIKQGTRQAKPPVRDVIKGSEFFTEMIPLESAQLECFPSVDLLLLDLCDDAEKGLGLLREMRLAGVRTEVIAYIARGDCETLRKVMRLGVCDCLVDPFDGTRFEQAVERFLRRLQIFDRRVLTQETADSVKKGVVIAPELPKGLQQKTLNSIRAMLYSKPEKDFTCGDIVDSLNISRITVQRYLAYLSEAGELTEAVNNRTGGRPCSLYRYKAGVFA